ncbi:MlaD family protein, partial [Shewanella sp. 0m-11]
KHPERLITGSVINFIPGTGAAKQQYSLLTQQPEPTNTGKLLLTLHAKSNPGISAGAEIRYKQIKIGHVLSSQLNKTFTQVEYQAEIDADFATLISANSHFIAESALTIDASLDGVKVSTRDLTTLTSGALSLVRGTNKALAKSGDSLYVFGNSKQATSFFNNQKLIKRRLYNQDGADLTAGSPIYYKKMQIGQVSGVEWQATNNDFAIDIAIERDFKSLLTDQTIFWRNSAVSINASLSGVEVEVAPLMGALKGGISLGLLEGNTVANG